MITCPNCSKENQDHYKFCLACGTKLPAGAPELPSAGLGVPPPPPLGPPPPLVGAPASFEDGGAYPQPGYPAPYPAPAYLPPPPPVPYPPAPYPAPAYPAAAEPPRAAVASAPCSVCGFTNPVGFRFCGRCGTTLTPEAPPSVQPGTRATNEVELGSARTMFIGDVVRPAPAPVEPEARPASAPSLVAKLVMLGPDGQPVGERVLSSEEALEVGRAAGPPWEDDAYLDPHHASLSVVDEGLHVEDHDSVNGVFLKLNERVHVHHGDQFRVGQELLLYEDLPEPTPTEDGTERMGSPNPGYWGRLSVLVDPENASSAHPIEGEGILIGREHGDITFPQDGYVSGNHCRIVGDDTGVYLEDLGSSNGTYMRVRSGQIVPFHSLILIGQKLFRIERED